MTMVEAYCVKCKAKVEMKSPQETTMKSGMKAMKGICPKCGTKVFRIMGKKK
jgi:DNA-directed RNA polymerase subunit RPC12/RpoP